MSLSTCRNRLAVALRQCTFFRSGSLNSRVLSVKVDNVNSTFLKSNNNVNRSSRFFASSAAATLRMPEVVSNSPIDPQSRSVSSEIFPAGKYKILDVPISSEKTATKSGQLLKSSDADGKSSDYLCVYEFYPGCVLGERIVGLDSTANGGNDIKLVESDAGNSEVCRMLQYKSKPLVPESTKTIKERRKLDTTLTTGIMAVDVLAPIGRGIQLLYLNKTSRVC